jgi:hypothetical protein
MSQSEEQRQVKPKEERQEEEPKDATNSTFKKGGAKNSNFVFSFCYEFCYNFVTIFSKGGFLKNLRFGL